MLDLSEDGFDGCGSLRAEVLRFGVSSFAIEAAVSGSGSPGRRTAQDLVHSRQGDAELFGCLTAVDLTGFDSG